jgi:hypothetical protein
MQLPDVIAGSGRSCRLHVVIAGLTGNLNSNSENQINQMKKTIFTIVLAVIA